MKQLVFIIIGLVTLEFAQVFSEEKWELLNPLPNANIINNLDFIDENNGICVGKMGMLIKTTNAGQDWIDVKTNVETDLNEIFYVNPEIIYACGIKGSIIKSTDGGNSWQKLNSQDTTVNLYSIYFRDKDFGFAVGDSSSILRTTNGGLDWQNQSEKSKYTYYKVKPIDNAKSYVILSYDNRVLITEDEGAIWDTTFNFKNWGIGSGAIKDVIFISNKIGYFVGLGSKKGDNLLFKTTNGGKTWDSLIVSSVGYYEHFHFFDEKNGIISTPNKFCLLTNDGGKTWNIDSNIIINDFVKLDFVNKDFIYGIDKKNQFVKSTDGGRTWNLPNSDEYKNKLNSIHMVNSTVGWAVGQNIVLKTTNGGNSWIKIEIDNVNQNSDNDYSEVFFLNSNEGWISPGNGKIFKTTDGGSTWIKGSLSLTSVYKIQFLNSNFGMACGDRYQVKLGTNGRICVTKDNNYNFAIRDFYGYPSFHIIYNVFLVDENIAYAIGQMRFYKTTDGGNTWQEKSFLNDYMTGLFFLNENYGFRSGGTSDGTKGTTTVSITKDGGETWTYKNTSHYPDDVVFLDTLYGFVSGYEGKISKTTDGGNSWFVFPQLSLNNINSMIFTNRQSGWAVGNNGTILKYSNDSTGPIYYYPDDDGKLTDKNINFEWFQFTGAQSYIFQLSKTKDFSQIIFEQETEINNISISNLEYGNTYYWRVKSKKATKSQTENFTDWGDVWNFKLLDPTNIAENTVENKTIIYPNPATDYITINLGSIGAGSNDNGASPIASIEIYDVMGVLIHPTPSASQPPHFDKLSATLNEGNLRIDVSNLSPGVYFVKIVGSNGSCYIVEKFVKM